MGVVHTSEIGRIVVDAAIAVHRELGPGLLETVYEVVLARELRERGLDVERQLPIPIEYGGFKFDEGFRADILVEGKVILELKSVEAVNHAHKKQLLTYLKLTGMKLGYWLNFWRSLTEGWHHTSRQRPCTKPIGLCALGVLARATWPIR